MTIELYKSSLTIYGKEMFSNLSFIANSGERVAITSSVDGSGTLVLQSLLGMRCLDSGWVCVGGEPVQRSTAAYFRRLMAYLPRQFAFGGATIEDIAQQLWSEHRNKSRKYSADDVQRALEQIGVSSSCFSTSFSQLDVATAQRALMSLTFMFDRPVALMDSPTLFQDIEGKRLVANYIASPKFNDVAMVVATNDAAILDVCDRVVKLI